MRHVASAILAAAAVTSAAAGPIDDRLAAGEPCRELPGLGETESVTLERMDVTLLPEMAEVAVVGHLVCRSAADALMGGDASVRIEAGVDVTLADCTAAAADVRLSDFGGSLGSLVEALAPSLEDALGREAGDTAEAACRDLLEMEDDSPALSDP